MDYTDKANVKDLLEDLASLRKKESQKYMDCEDAIKQLQTENERLRKYARHRKDCMLNRMTGRMSKRHCTCGFEQEQMETCPTCKGRGLKPEPNGNYDLDEPCDDCWGKGKVEVEK